MEIKVNVQIELGEQTKEFIAEVLKGLTASKTLNITNADIPVESKKEVAKAEPKKEAAKPAAAKEKTKKEVAKAEPDEDEESAAVTEEEVRTYIANLLKSNKELKTDIQALISKHGGKKLSEVPAENLADLFDDVKALEEDQV